jgi:hypothetical protein
MPVPKSEKPATAASVNRLQRDDRLGRQINFTANASSQQIHGLGPRPLFELLAEIVCGAPSMERFERYARLNREHGHFIRANGGDQFPPKFLIVKGND